MLGKKEIKPKKASYTMRSIVEASRILRDKVAYQIGSGDNFKLGDKYWTQNWKG